MVWSRLHNSDVPIWNDRDAYDSSATALKGGHASPDRTAVVRMACLEVFACEPAHRTVVTFERSDECAAL